MAGQITKRAIPGLALAYLFFVLFPHFEAVSHAHAGGEQAHHHTWLSGHDLLLERAALEAAPQGVPNGELDPATNTPDTSNTAAKVTGKGITTATPRAHTHVQEDPNLPALAAAADLQNGMATKLRAPETVPTFVPALAILASPARAPPRG